MLTLIIVSYNSASILQQCMDELLRSTVFRIIIVDNNSPDASAEILERRYPNAEVIPLDQNIGYGRAANIGLDKVASRYALLLNPDMIACSTDIQALLDYITKEKLDAALYAPAVKKSDFLRMGPIEKKWVIGAAMLFDMNHMQQIGFFDEQFFLFYEEKDLCLRIRKANQNILLCSDFYFNHLKGKACPPNDTVNYVKNWHIGWSSMYYLTKHGLNKGKHRASRLLLNYYIRRFLSLSRYKRKKFRIRALGIQAYLHNEKAFLKNGSAHHTYLMNADTGKKQ